MTTSLLSYSTRCRRYTGNTHQSQGIESSVFKAIQRPVNLLIEFYAENKKQWFCAVYCHIHGQIHHSCCGGINGQFCACSIAIPYWSIEDTRRMLIAHYWYKHVREHRTQQGYAT